MTGHAPEPKYQPDATENARKARGAASTKRSAETPPFDWDRAIQLARKTLAGRKKR